MACPGARNAEATLAMESCCEIMMHDWLAITKCSALASIRARMRAPPKL